MDEEIMQTLYPEQYLEYAIKKRVDILSEKIEEITKDFNREVTDCIRDTTDEDIAFLKFFRNELPDVYKEMRKRFKEVYERDDK